MHFVVLHDAKIIIFWSAKCGATSLKFILLKYLGDTQTVGHTHQKFNKYNLQNKQPDLDRVKNYKLVVLLRNPYDRLVSGFINKYVNGEYQTPKNIGNFADFVNTMSNNKQIMNNVHFVPQTSGPGWELLKKLGNPPIDLLLETHQVNEIAKLLGLEMESVHRNKTKKTNLPLTDVSQLFNLNLDDLRKINRTQSYNTSQFFNKKLQADADKIYHNDLEFFAGIGKKFSI